MYGYMTVKYWLVMGINIVLNMMIFSGPPWVRNKKSWELLPLWFGYRHQSMVYTLRISDGLLLLENLRESDAIQRRQTKEHFSEIVLINIQLTT